MIFNDIINKLILNESVSIADVNDVIDRHKRVIINYHTKGEDKNTGARVVEVYAYGLTKAGNPVIRCFQPYGDTTSRVPSWKFFRLDRISAWKETNQTFNRPADFFYKGLGDFNPNGDDTMSVVYKIAKFGSNNIINTEIQTPTNGPRMKSSSTEPYRTDTERGMERLRQQLQNPIKLSDIKTKNGFKNLDTPSSNDTGPKMKEPTKTVNGNDRDDKSSSTEPYRTDTERGMERLRQQLQNPKKIDLDKLRSKLGDTSKPIKYSDLVKRVKGLNNDEITDNSQTIDRSSSTEPYRTDTERGMERLRQQLQNPKKIDLDKLRRR